MSIQPSELLDWADCILLDGGSCETTVRASVSRAYYASLHQSIEIFEIEDFSGQASSHQAVVTELVSFSRGAGQGRRQAAEIAKLLVRLKRARVDADYKLAHDIQLVDAQRAVAMAREVAGACADAQRLRSQ